MFKNIKNADLKNQDGKDTTNSSEKGIGISMKSMVFSFHTLDPMFHTKAFLQRKTEYRKLYFCHRFHSIF